MTRDLRRTFELNLAKNLKSIYNPKLSGSMLNIMGDLAIVMMALQCTTLRRKQIY